MDYYTYAYLRKDLSPYYVGKGKGNRILSDLRSIHKPTDISRIVFLRENMTEKESFNNEVEMIKLWGRKDLKTGMLRNKTDGGEGSSGGRRTKETRKLISLIRTGKKHTNETKAKMSLVRTGEKRTDETKAKIRLATTGLKRTEKQKENMRLAWTFRKLSKSSKAGEK